MKLYDDQIDAVKRMKNGCILCGDVGSGKSITSLSYYYICQGGSWDFLRGGNFKKIPNRKPLYIITTAKKRDDLEWEKELARFLIKDTEVTIDSWNNIKKYSNVKGAFFIFDEQRVVGWGTWTKSFLKITKANQWILLSATPGDTWSDYMPVFIANGYFKNKTQFNAEHVVFKRFSTYPIIDRYLNVGKLIKCRNEILVDMKYSRKAEQHHVDILCEYNIELYKQSLKDQWDYENDIPVESASEMCYVLRKIVNSDESRKKAILDIYSKHRKIIIFYSFDYELDILRNMPWGIDAVVHEWNGHKHQPIPNCINWVYLVNYAAGAEGWNCVATDTMIFYSQQYSYKQLVQACGRIDRLNTSYNDLYYYHLWSHASIDITIRRALKNKKTFNERDFVKIRSQKTQGLL